MKQSLKLAAAMVIVAASAAAQPAPPYIGVAYYPEVAGAQMSADIARMQDIGVNLARFGEFAWSRMETREGEYHFGWLHSAVKAFADAGIAVVLCTPTATPPIWLSEAHPDILRVNANGRTVTHGGRRQYCPNSETYHRYSVGIAARLAEEFADDPGIVAWQIDNEFWEECYCTQCETAFHVWLKNHFGTIRKLNDAWLTVLWSQEYQSFDQVPLPNPQSVGARHHPSLSAAYKHFMSDSYVSYSDAQAAALRRHTSKPVTTNAHNPRYQRIDYADLFRNLDLVCTDSYAGPENLSRYAFEADWMRALGKPFWLAETASWATAPPGALRAKMWLTYALGADAVSFWLWRAHWAGQELEHPSLLYWWGDECAGTPEIRQVGADLKTHAAWLRATRPKPAAVALAYGLPSQWQFSVSSIASGFNYDTAITAFHRLLVETGVPRDVIMPGAEVTDYQVVFSPYCPALDEVTLVRMKDFVERGGTWVLGPLSACRTVEATAHRDACYGAAFEEWLGVHVRHRLAPGDSTKLAGDNQTSDCRWWCDAYQPTGNQRVLAKYQGGPLDGFAAVVECPVGKGRVILLGTQPDDAWLGGLIRRLAPKPGITADPGVIAAERVTADGKPAGVILINTHPTAAKCQLPGGETAILAGHEVKLLPQN